MKCVICKKPIRSQPYRKHEFLITGQGTHRNFGTTTSYWHESCWLEEERAETERRRINDIEFQKELAEARSRIA